MNKLINKGKINRGKNTKANNHLSKLQQKYLYIL